MCRMIAIISQTPFTQKILEKSWEHFRAMSMDSTTSHELNKMGIGNFTHDHGWGVGYIDHETKNHKKYISNTPVYETKIGDELINELKNSRALIFHSRKASPGLPVNPDYNHPFSVEYQNISCTFCHNGTILDSKFLSHSENLQVSTESDTEKLFYNLLSKYVQDENSFETLESLKSAINEIPRYTGANYLSFFGTTFLASTNFRRFPKYFTLHYHQNRNFVYIASEPTSIIGSVWKIIPNHSILRIKEFDISTLEIFN